VYAPGVIHEGSLDVDGVEDLTGIGVRSLESAAPAVVEVLPGADPLLAGLDAPVTYGAPEPIRPLFAADPRSGCLGRIRGQEASGLSVRRFGDWTSIYSAAPCLPATLLRRLLANSGVHLYVDGDDIVYGNRSFLAVHSRDAGRRSLRLPGPGWSITDVVSGAVIGRGERDVILDTPAGHTTLLATTRGEVGDSV
jgi:hypothetical protein